VIVGNFLSCQLLTTAPRLEKLNRYKSLSTTRDCSCAAIETVTGVAGAPFAEAVPGRRSSRYRTDGAGPRSRVPDSQLRDLAGLERVQAGCNEDQPAITIRNQMPR